MKDDKKSAPPPAPPQAKPAPAPATVLKTPREWFALNKDGAYLMRLTAHNVAATRHGWAVHRHHAGAPIKLSRADYDAALVAAEQNRTHTPALSPYKKTKKAKA